MKITVAITRLSHFDDMDCAKFSVTYHDLDSYAAAYEVYSTTVLEIQEAAACGEDYLPRMSVTRFRNGEPIPFYFEQGVYATQAILQTSPF